MRIRCLLNIGVDKRTQKALKDPQALNSYSYVKNNPVGLVDPDGQWFKELIIGQQSWSGFANEVGEATMYMGGGWQTAMDHPIAAGAAVGVGSGVAAYGVAAGVTALSMQYLGGAGTACLVGCQKSAESLQSTPQALGKLGEQLSGLMKNTERITSATNTANYRIPDGLNHVTKTLSEVKNVKYQGFTNQIKDSLMYSQNNGYKFELITRSDTVLSNPLQNVIKNGNITHKLLSK